MANGLFGGGLGTAVSPLLIEDADDLSAIRRNTNLYYKLVYNINLGIAPYNEGEGWVPIIDAFIGSLDGNGKAICNLYINRPTANSQGLFRKFVGVVKDLSIINCNITANNYVGALTGGDGTIGPANIISPTPTITRCRFTGKVVANDYAGSVIGEFFTAPTTIGNIISDCYSSIDLSVTGANCGGFMYSARGNFGSTTASYCFYNGKMDSVSTLADPFCKYTAVVSVTNTVFFDSTKTTFKATSVLVAVLGKTTTQLNTVGTYVGYETRAYNSIPVWKLVTGVYPSLYHENHNKVFIFADGGYWTFVTSWIKLYTTMPTKEQAMTSGMDNLSHISATDWEFMKQFLVIDVISFIEKNGVIVCHKTTRSLDVTQTSSTKTILSRRISFSDFNNNIIKIQA